MRILVIDNEPALLRAVVRMLVSCGHDPIGVGSYEAGVSCLSSDTHFDAVLSDHDLGSNVGTGADLLRLARRLKPGTRLVLMSGETQAYADLSPFLRKPFSRDTLNDALFMR